MEKITLKAIFGNYSKAARALGVTKGAVSQWKDTLTVEQSDRVIGAAIRLGIYKASHFKVKSNV